MWDIALEIWKKNPIIGTGLADYKEDKNLIQANNIRYKNLPVYTAAHSLYFHSLATTGLVGFISMCFAMIVLPIRFFLQIPAVNNDRIRLAGLMLICAFAVFGLTAAWVVRSSLISIFLVYLTALISGLNQKPKSL